MKLFGKKKFPLLTSLPEDQWRVSRREVEGHPMFVRVNTSAKKYVGHPQLPHRLGIAIPLHAPNPHGLPGDEELAQLNDIEEALFDAIARDGRAVLIITTSGMREFVSYVNSAQRGELIVEALRRDIHPRNPALCRGRQGLGFIQAICGSSHCC